MSKIMFCLSKKLLSFLLALLLVNVSSVAISQDESLETQMIAQWERYLRVEENLLAEESWALAYVQTYCESGEWSDYVNARSACASYLETLRTLREPISFLTPDQYVDLQLLGVDAAFIAMHLSNWNMRVSYATMDFQCLQASLMNDVYTSSGMDYLRKFTVELQYVSECEARQLCNTTNYLLLAISSTPEVHQFWEALPTTFPLIGRYCLEWTSNQDTLEKRMQANIKETEQSMLTIISLQGDQQNILAEMKSELENELSMDDITTMLERVYEPKARPTLLPLPQDFFSSEDCGVVYYSSIYNSDEVKYFSSVDDLSAYKPWCVLFFLLLEDEMMDAYPQILENTGCTCVSFEKVEADETGWSRMFEINGTLFLVDKKDGTLRIWYKARELFFAPKWYINNVENLRKLHNSVLNE